MKANIILITAALFTACFLTSCNIEPINISGNTNTIVATKSIEGTITNKFTDSYTESNWQFFYKTDNFVMPIGSEDKATTDYYFTVTDNEGVSVMFEVDVLTYNAYSIEQAVSIEKKDDKYYLGGEKIVPVKKLENEKSKSGKE